MFASKIATILLSLGTAASALAVENMQTPNLNEYTLAVLDAPSKQIMLQSIMGELNAIFPGLDLTCSIPAEDVEKRRVHGETEHRRVLAEAEKENQVQLGNCSTSSSPIECRVCVGLVSVGYSAAIGACSATAMAAEVETAGVWSIPVWTAYTSCCAGALTVAGAAWTKCY